MPKLRNRKSPVVRYPWQKWFDKGRFTLRKGKHYHCQTHSMATLIRLTAAKSKYGLSGVSLRINDDVIKAEVY